MPFCFLIHRYSAAIDFQTKVLRNGTDDKFESDQFRSGDDLYLSFQSPIDGYLAIYLVDAESQAYCLLPYRNQADGVYSIEANHRYLLFNTRLAQQSERPFVDEYVMTCERDTEYNQIYAIFSPNHFAKAIDANTDAVLPRQLSYDDFQQWLVKCRKSDLQINVKKILIVVKK